MTWLYSLLAVLAAAGVISWLLVLAQRDDDRKIEPSPRQLAEAAAEAEAAELAALERLRVARQQTAMTALTDAKDASEKALAAYRRSVQHLERAESWFENAAKHRADSAFSPFWESCENGMLDLEAHRSAVDAVRRHTDDYQRALCLVEGGAPDLLPEMFQFPTGVREAATIDAGTRVAERGATLIHAAQSDFHFAAIFEQRRTTAAVIAGFRSLNEAVDGMSGAIISSYQSLERAVDDLSSATEGVGHKITDGFDAIANPLVVPSDSLVGQVREINVRLGDIARR
jgi:hypothetical protein